MIHVVHQPLILSLLNLNMNGIHSKGGEVFHFTRVSSQNGLTSSLQIRHTGPWDKAHLPVHVRYPGIICLKANDAERGARCIYTILKSCSLQGVSVIAHR